METVNNAPGFITDKNRIYLPTLANIIQAYNSPAISEEWKEKHRERIEQANELLPHGSGIDGKCYFDTNNSTKDKLFIFVEFHHMDTNGFYCVGIVYTVYSDNDMKNQVAEIIY